MSINQNQYSKLIDTKGPFFSLVDWVSLIAAAAALIGISSVSGLGKATSNAAAPSESPRQTLSVEVDATEVEVQPSMAVDAPSNAYLLEPAR